MNNKIVDTKTVELFNSIFHKPYEDGETLEDRIQKYAVEFARGLYTEQDIRNAFIAGMENIDCNQEEGMFSILTVEEWFNKFKKQ
jgi:hypothetical protein